MKGRLDFLFFSVPSVISVVQAVFRQRDSL
ncbi:MAG: hypothetical protein QG619_2814, partial [Pseudomonadota bacterium]|nr:hypothetical protein [Pseudomonadota bacterium]